MVKAFGWEFIQLGQINVNHDFVPANQIDSRSIIWTETATLLLRLFRVGTARRVARETGVRKAYAYATENTFMKVLSYVSAYSHCPQLTVAIYDSLFTIYDSRKHL